MGGSCTVRFSNLQCGSGWGPLRIVLTGRGYGVQIVKYSRYLGLILLIAPRSHVPLEAIGKKKFTPALFVPEWLKVPSNIIDATDTGSREAISFAPALYSIPRPIA